MHSTIIDTGNVAELNGLEEGDEISNMIATEQPENKGIEFHVSMHGHTFHDMQDLIVHAAAQMLVGKFGNAQLAKEIEAKAISLISKKADDTLSRVTSDIIDQPVTPKFGDKQPVTMRELIGLTGREYLAARVDSFGKPASSSYDTKTRMEYIVGEHMKVAFKREIEAATNAVICDVQKAVKAQHKAFLDAEKARLREALQKITA